MFSTEPIFSIGILEVHGNTLTTWFLMIALTILCLYLTRGLSVMPTTKRQVALELAVEKLLHFLTPFMGKRELAEQYFPVIGSFFFIILAGNYSGLLPGAGRVAGFQAPTGTLSYCIGLALFSMIYAEYSGFKRKGIHYLKHVVSPNPVMLPMNLMELGIKPLSLSLRLFGNIYGEEILVAGIFSLFPAVVPVPFMFLSMFFGLIQAAVFTILSATYVASAVGAE